MLVLLVPTIVAFTFTTMRLPDMPSFLRYPLLTARIAAKGCRILVMLRIRLSGLRSIIVLIIVLKRVHFIGYFLLNVLLNFDYLITNFYLIMVKIHPSIS